MMESSIVKTKRQLGQLSRRKGAKEELDVRDVLNAIDDVGAARVPLSGAGGGRFAGDVSFDIGGEGYPDIWTIECKLRKTGFAKLYDWIGNNEILTVRANENERLYVLREGTIIALLKALKAQNIREGKEIDVFKCGM